MKKIIILLLIAAFNISFASSQNTFKAILKDSATQETLVGATALIKGTSNGASSNANGEITISNIPVGKHTIVFSYTGYKKS